ncbi:MAG: type II toxin-antitoxin system prevent-host-death family antitoxin [Myxococcota bacterium]|jgi:prevent-host-death family protein
MNTKAIGAYEAKVHLSEILEKVRTGQVYVITRRGVRLAELRPVSAEATHPIFGSDKGIVVVADDFDDPIPGMEEYIQ